MTLNSSRLKRINIKSPWVGLSLAALAIVAAALLIYLPLLFPSNPDAIHPWSSDGWGHLMKTQYLIQQIGQGHWYPQLFPGWYNGLQVLRFYGPLPYYLIAVLFKISGDIFVAGNLLLFLLAAFGGLCFLLYRRWLGLLPAAAGGILFLMLPDNLRIAFAEGNFPRVVAAALLPLTFYFLLKILEKGSKYNIIWLALCVAVMILAHAMMAAIFLLCMVIFAFVYWFLARTGPRVIASAALGMFSGVLLSAWWLFPSLIGGALEVDQVSSSEALARFPLSVSLNPLERLHDKEIFYIGLSLVIVAIAVLWLHRRLSPLTKSLIIVGLATALLSSTLFSGIYDAIPMSYIFRPMRFLSFSGFALVLGLAGFGSWIWAKWQAKTVFRGALFGLLILITVLDFMPSLGLVMARVSPPDLMAVSEKLKELPGWREATLDLSRLGSAPSYLFTAVSGREQIFGWAYQGSNTVPMTSSINFATQEGYEVYAIDRMERLGADDIVIEKGVGLPETIGEKLLEQGYSIAYSDTRLDLYHKDGAPRAYVLSHSILGIGDGAYNAALLFPEIQVGKSSYVDDYSLDFLKNFDRILLSRFQWRDKSRAEALITAYAAQGGHAIVDLTGSPVDVLSKEPHFLGVYGEPVQESNQVTLNAGSKQLQLMPFRADYQPWQAVSPQGLDVEEITFNYYGETGAALGYKLVGEHPVDFIGLNLMFHAVITGDPAATGILEDELGTVAGTVPQRQTVPFNDYRASSSGYEMGYRLAETTDIVVPVAYQDGTLVTIDGKPVTAVSVDNLVSFSAPSGQHAVRITFRATGIFLIGKIASVLGLLVVISILLVPRRFFIKDEKHAGN